MERQKPGVHGEAAHCCYDATASMEGSRKSHQKRCAQSGPFTPLVC